MDFYIIDLNDQINIISSNTDLNDLLNQYVKCSVFFNEDKITDLSDLSELGFIDGDELRLRYDIFKIFEMYGVNYEKWDGNCWAFKRGVAEATSDTLNVLNDTNFIREVIKLDRWNGSCFFFHEDIHQNIDLMKEVIRSPKWNGDCGSICTDKSLGLEIVKSPRWNGIAHGLSRDLLGDMEILDEIVASPRWDGHLEFIPEHIYTDEEFCYRVLNSGRWYMDFEFFNQDLFSRPDVVRKIINSRRWFGNCYFGSNIMSDETICYEIIDSPYWGGSLTNFNHDILKKPEFLKRVLNNSRWNCCTDDLPPEIANSIDFALDFLDSNSFCGWFKCFKSEAMKSHAFIEKLLNSPKWDGNLFVFCRYEIDDIGLAEKIIDSPKWDGWCDGFSEMLMDNLEFCSKIIRSEKWKKITISFSQRVMNDENFKKLLDEVGWDKFTEDVFHFDDW